MKVQNRVCLSCFCTFLTPIFLGSVVVYRLVCVLNKSCEVFSGAATVYFTHLGSKTVMKWDPKAVTTKRKQSFEVERTINGHSGNVLHHFKKTPRF